jgi:hypothetical protein
MSATQFMTSPATRKQDMYQKTKVGHQRIVERFQRRMMEEKVLKEEQRKMDLQRRVNQYLNYSSLVQTVKTPTKTPAQYKSPKSTIAQQMSLPDGFVDRKQEIETKKRLSLTTAKTSRSSSDNTSLDSARSYEPGSVIRENTYEPEHEDGEMISETSC